MGAPKKPAKTRKDIDERDHDMEDDENVVASKNSKYDDDDDDLEMDDDLGGFTETNYDDDDDDY